MSTAMVLNEDRRTALKNRQRFHFRKAIARQRASTDRRVVYADSSGSIEGARILRKECIR